MSHNVHKMLSVYLSFLLLTDIQYFDISFVHGTEASTFSLKITVRQLIHKNIKLHFIGQ